MESGLKHIYLSKHDNQRAYKSKKSPPSPPLKSIDSSTQGKFVLRSYNSAISDYNSFKDNHPELKLIDPSQEEGMFLEIQSFEGYELPLDRFDNQDIHLCNVSYDDESTIFTATIFLPLKNRNKFLNKIQKYLDPSLIKRQRNIPLISSISSLKLASLESFWTDKKPFPEDIAQEYWWEIWLTKGTDYKIDQNFIIQFCKSIGATYSGQMIELANTIIVLIKATLHQLEGSLLILTAIEELKYPGGSPREFIESLEKDNNEWAKELLSRIQINTDSNIKISILDTGINYNNKLLAPFITSSDCTTYDQNWPLYTQYGNINSYHGSWQAGVCLFGDLYKALASTSNYLIGYKLESGRIIPPAFNSQPNLYGAITYNVLAKLESHSQACRIYSMAVTADDSDGKPSSWSSTIDNFCYDHKRLFVISAGNNRNQIHGSLNSWDHIAVAPIQDPAQAWNAITVGAYTEKYLITDPTFAGWKLVSEPGELTASSTSSLLWDWGNNPPFKPDVVAEGGNYIKPDDSSNADSIDDLSILTTGGDSSLFAVHGDTSAATAHISNYLARIHEAYPKYWAETIRGILIHSAEWTEAMKQKVKNEGNNESAKLSMLKMVGYGVPNIEKSLFSLKNRATIIIESTFTPFKKEKSEIKFCDMNVQKLPIPNDFLLGIDSQTNLKLKVTLSYFIQPNPTSKSFSSKYSYQSFGLRLKVQGSNEKYESFLASINKNDLFENYERHNGKNGWFLKDNLRRRGTVISDIWEGSAADLAGMEHIAIYPVSGWWRNKKAMAINLEARYSLIVTLEADNDIDLYNAVTTKIATTTNIINPIMVTV